MWRNGCIVPYILDLEIDTTKDQLDASAALTPGDYILLH
jgi:hypothetical protein